MPRKARVSLLGMKEIPTLRRMAAERGIEVPSGATKYELVLLLQSLDYEPTGSPKPLTPRPPGEGFSSYRARRRRKKRWSARFEAQRRARLERARQESLVAILASRST